MPRGLPSPRVVFALSLAVFAAGFVLGAAAGPSAPSAGAAGGAVANPIVIVWPQVAPPAAPLAPAAAPPAPATEPAPAPEETPVAAAEEPAATEPTTEPEPEPTETDPADTTPTTPEPTLPPIKHVWLVVLTGHALQDGFGPDSHSVLLRETLPKKGMLLLDHHQIAGGSLENGLALITGGAPAGSLPEQLTGAGLTWKAYVESSGAPDAPPPCQLPAPRNPFANVPALAADCGTNVVGLDQLTADLASADSTPNFSYLVPNACHDGSDVPCAPGVIPGTAASDGWLRTVLRQIRATETYKQDGLIVVTFDQGGDGKVGALLLSHFLAPGSTIDAPTDQYSLLKTIEDLFGLTHLGKADDPVVPALTAQQLAKPTG